MNIKKLHIHAKIPTRANPNDAGADLYSIESIVIPPLSRSVVKTGIALEIPVSYYGRVAPRSGLAAKHGIDVLAGVIDSSYRGEIGVVLLNTDSSNSFTINVGDRIAQLIIESHYNPVFIEALDLLETNRGEGGFGSSGTN